MSDAPGFSEPRTVSDPQAAAYLANPYRAMYLYPFIGRERTASDVARTYKISLKTLHYQIGRMIKLGLLCVSRVEPRRGSPVKHYRASADAFFVPHAATGEETIEDLVSLWSNSLQPLFLRSYAKALEEVSGHWGIRISRDDQGVLQVHPAMTANADWNAYTPDAPFAIEGWLTDLRLDFQDAKAMQYDLAALYLKYLNRQGATRYIVRIAVAPMSENDELPPAW
jgi:hypothetical protein